MYLPCFNIIYINSKFMVSKIFFIVFEKKIMLKICNYRI